MHGDDERLDAAIGEAARQMTAAEPHPDFRRRVMARFDRKPTRRMGWLALAALSAAAGLVIALVVQRPARQTVPLKPDATSAQTTLDGTPALLPPSPTRSDASRHVVALRERVPRGMQVPPAPETSSDVEPLATEPIDFESISVTNLAPQDSIAIQPVQAAAPIAVAPLGLDDEGDPR